MSEKKKAYIALFTCGITRGMHLGLVEDMSAPEFNGMLQQGRSGRCKNCVTCESQNGGFRKKNLSQVCHKILAILSG